VDRQSKTRISPTWLRIELLLMAAIVIGYASGAVAEPVVADFASIDATTTTWRLPKDAKFVRRMRGTTIAVVSVAELLPTDRVTSCDDPLVLPGSTTKCTTTQSDRKDNWRLVAVLFPVAQPPAQKVTDIKVGWKYAQQAGETPIEEITGYRVWLRLQKCDPAQALCPAVAFGDPIVLGVVNAYQTSAPGEYHEACVQVQAMKGTTEGLLAQGCDSQEPPIPETVPGAVSLNVEVSTRTVPP
jgi:hypothetical protein